MSTTNKLKPVPLGYCHELGRKIPMQGFECESCVELPVKDGDTDYDNAKYIRVHVATHDEALAWAKSKIEKDCWGAIPITEYTLELIADIPAIYHKVYGETEHIEE